MQPEEARKRTILILPGDGIGPEVCAAAEQVLRAVAAASKHPENWEFVTRDVGGAAIDASGNPLPDETLEIARRSSAILLGAVGGPKWTGGAVRPEEGLLRLRKELGLFANIRPVSLAADSLASRSPLKEELVKKVDIVFVRELTGGAYFGPRQEEKDGVAYDTMIYSRQEIERITRVAAEIARGRNKRILSVDKANVLASSRLWRKVVNEVLAREYPEIRVEHQLVDSCAMLLVQKPAEFDVILTENLFGDILSDEASVLPGSLGLLPSASIREWGTGGGLFEPVHGSAPDIAGKGIANPLGAILSAAMLLRFGLGLDREAAMVEKAVRQVLDSGVRTADLAQASDSVDPVGTSAMTDRVLQHLAPLLARGPVRPMTLCEKILCHHAIGLERPEVKPDEMICVKVDWTLASELTWKGMEKTYDEMGRPSIWRNDRFWLAIDHTVDPAINHLPKPQELIQASTQFSKEANLTDFYGPNVTILHTEFYRERVQPGMLVVGADSHSCSAGGVGAFAIGLGAADVVMPLVTGETWLRVPETVRINYTGAPKFGIGGKDVILATMGSLKRNTVAFERSVEYTGNIQHLSCDARFAISNMTAEFGGIAGVFPADEVTAAYIAKRSDTRHKSASLFMRADPGAQYVATYEIRLDEIVPLVALYPSPDNCVPASTLSEMQLDGCFIGACTTAEEDLILAALVLEAGLKSGLTPVLKGRRLVTPGSVNIVAKLRRLGLIQIYEAAGYEIGAVSCSMCLGISKDKAGEGEVWLSSQNRNFKNRMGKGSIGNLASAATVAASSFEMRVKDPTELLALVDRKRYSEMLEIWSSKGESFVVSEPAPVLLSAKEIDDSTATTAQAPKVTPAGFAAPIRGFVQRFGDHIDTDAIIPAEFMPGKDDLDLGTHCFQYFRPDFVKKVSEGFTIIVAGEGFGTGSSREEAPRALKGCGAQAVIAKSFSFIYGRNQMNMAFLGVILKDERFYELANEGAEVQISVADRTIQVAGETFSFTLTTAEERLLAGGGLLEMYKSYGNQLFRASMLSNKLSAESGTGCGSGGHEGGKKAGGSCESTKSSTLAW